MLDFSSGNESPMPLDDDGGAAAMPWRSSSGDYSYMGHLGGYTGDRLR